MATSRLKYHLWEESALVMLSDGLWPLFPAKMLESDVILGSINTL